MLGLFAFWVNWWAGHRGLFLYDTSIAFDGGWRLLQGQAPYRDFAMSHAPGAYFYEALILRWFGVTMTSMVIAAALLNAVASLMVAHLGWRFSPVLGLIGGFLTAIWFQTPTGFLQIEQCSFFFNIAGLWLLLQAGAESGTRPWLLRLAGGVTLAYAILCKQNSGGFFLPVALAAMLFLPFSGWRPRIHALIPVALGGLACTGVFVWWLFAQSDPQLFWHHAVEIPRRFGGERLAGSGSWWENLLRLVLSLKQPLGPRLLSIASLAVGLGVLWQERQRLAKGSAIVSGAVLLLGITFFHNAFIVTALNEAANGVPLIGLQAILFAGLAIWLAPALRERFLPPGPLGAVAARPLVWQAAFALLLVAVTAHGLRYTIWRGVNEFMVGTRFTDPIHVPGLERVFWGEPTYADVNQLTIRKREDLEGVARFLAGRQENFFVFPVSTILYGLLGRPSVQPWLFFLEGHSFGTEDLPRLDDMTIASFKRHNVRIFVQEQVSFLGEHRELRKLPKTTRWLQDHFAQTRQFGTYEVWEWREPATEATN